MIDNEGVEWMTSEEIERLDRRINLKAAQLFRKHARLLRQRAATLGNHHLLNGLLDAAELAEETATNLEAIK